MRAFPEQPKKPQWSYTKPQLGLMDLMSRMDAPACLCDTWLKEMFGHNKVHRLRREHVERATANLPVLARRTQDYIPPKAGILGEEFLLALKEVKKSRELA
jgi:hypothetical protein